MVFIKKPKIKVIDIIEAYETYGDDFLSIDAQNIRTYKTFANYLDIFIKKANGEIVKSPFCSMDNMGVTTTTSLRAPHDQKYSQVRVGISDANSAEESNNIKAILILCNAFTNVFNKMIKNNIVTHRREDTRKKNANGKPPVLLISTEAKTCVQTTREDKNTKEIEELDNPIFWVNIPKRKNKKGTNQVPRQFGDVCYRDEDGGDGEPFMIHEFDVTFYDIEQRCYDNKTGKPSFKLLGDEDEDGNVVLNNTNVHEYLTCNSILCGAFEFSVTVTSRQAKLDIALYGSCHVKQGEYDDPMVNSDDEIAQFAAKCNIDQADSVSDNGIDSFAATYAKPTKPTKPTKPVKPVKKMTAPSKRTAQAEVDDDEGSDFESDED